MQNCSSLSRRAWLQRTFVLSLSCALPLGGRTYAQSTTQNEPAIRLVEAARSQIGQTVYYNGAYEGIAYPNGDVPMERGVCTDVIIRAYRKAFGFDLQKAIHEDMKANFSLYPKNWGAKKTDRNIDHRRVPNQQMFFKRHGTSLGTSKKIEDFLPGDVVSQMLPGNLPHILIVSDRKSSSGIPLAIHNIGRGTQEENILFSFDLTGHYRFFPKSPNI